MKEAAYKGMVHPILEYGSSVWDPYTDDKLQEELEKVQNRAARFVTRNYVYETAVRIPTDDLIPRLGAAEISTPLTKLTHKFHVYATYKFLPAVLRFWRIRELTGFCMQMSFTYT